MICRRKTIPTVNEKVDKLSPDAIRAQLRGAAKDTQVYVYDELDSTNAQVKRLLSRQFDAPLLVAANSQTAGRGRLGRSFYSPADTGVYFSLGIRATQDPTQTLRWTAGAAVAVVRAIESLTGIQVQIKWVNDIYLNDKKICGILCEAVTGAQSGKIEHVIIGIGINLFTSDFPPECSDRAGSLYAENLSRETLISEVASNLLALLRPDAAGFMDDYRAHSMVIGQMIYYHAGSGQHVLAKALDITGNGGLIVEHPDGARLELTTGEITLRLATASHPD